MTAAALLREVFEAAEFERLETPLQERIRAHARNGSAWRTSLIRCGARRMRS